MKMGEAIRSRLQELQAERRLDTGTKVTPQELLDSRHVDPGTSG